MPIAPVRHRAKRKNRSINNPRFLAGVRRHASHVGQIMWGWNFLQAAMFQIFHQVTSPANEDLALTLWHTIQSDKTQREMMLGAAQVTLANNPRLLARIEWVVKRANDLSPFRNDGAHTGISLGYNAGSPNRLKVYPDRKAGKPSAVARLLDKPVETYWRKVRDDLWVLGRYASSLAGQVNDAHYPSLQKPRLLMLQPKSKGASRKHRRRAKPKS